MVEDSLKKALRDQSALATIYIMDLLLPKFGLVSQKFMDIVLLTFSLPFLVSFFVEKAGLIALKGKWITILLGSYLIFSFKHLEKITKSFKEFLSLNLTFFIAAILFAFIASLFYLLHKSLDKRLGKKGNLIASMSLTILISTLMLEGLKIVGLFGIIR